MGWQINDALNTLVIPADFQDQLAEAAEGHGHTIYFGDDDTIGFDDDAMEHMDFLDEDWAKDIISEAKASGIVIFINAENAKDIWGYSFSDGVSSNLTKKQCLLAMADVAE